MTHRPPRHPSSTTEPTTMDGAELGLQWSKSEASSYVRILYRIYAWVSVAPRGFRNGGAWLQKGVSLITRKLMTSAGHRDASQSCGSQTGLSPFHLLHVHLGQPFFFGEMRCFGLCSFTGFSVLITGELQTKTFHLYLWQLCGLKFERMRIDEELTWTHKSVTYTM